MPSHYLSIAKTLSEVVPLISRWIGGSQSETHARTIVKAAQRITGIDESSALLKSLQNDPKLLTEFQQALMEMESQLEQSILQDREYARLRDIAISQAGHVNYRADIMVLAAAIGLVSCLATITLFRETLPGEAVGIISTVAGIFGSCLKDAYAFEFGSSRGSKLKDKKLNRLIGTIVD